MTTGNTTPVLWIGPANVRSGEQDARLVLNCQHGQTQMLVLCGSVLPDAQKWQAIRATMDMHQGDYPECHCLDGLGLPNVTMNLN
jgi:hypothetical protein